MAVTVETVSPRTGPSGINVTITGTGFGAAPTVDFDGVAANVVASTPVSITVVTPVHAPGPSMVRVTAGRLRGSLFGGFTFVDPAVTNVNPPTGASAGGIPVTITGDFFVNGVGLGVTFGGVAGINVQWVSAKVLTVTTPPGAVGQVAVQVVNPSARTGDLNPGFTYCAPLITGIAPLSDLSAGGADVIVTGNYFAAGGQLGVTFGGTASPAVILQSATSLKATTPQHAPGVNLPVVVTSGDGSTGNAPAHLAFTFQAPVVTALSPDSDSTAGGATVTITGNYFAAGPQLGVTFGGTASPRVVRNSVTSIDADTPAHAAGQNLPVVVTSGDGVTANSPVNFEFVEPPTVTAVVPGEAQIAGKKAVTITGTHFVNGPSLKVEFGGVAATDVTFVDAQTLTATAPAHAAGQVDIVVTNPAPPPARLSGRLANGFRYTATPPASQNEVTFLMDGEEFFEQFRLEMENLIAAPVAPLGTPPTYFRMAYWKADSDVEIGDRNHFAQSNPNDLLTAYFDRVIRRGHDVDIILWGPNWKDRRAGTGAVVSHSNFPFADAVAAIDRQAVLDNANGILPVFGRARTYLERYEGWTGSSNHQKIAIFSIAGERTVLLGGLNLVPMYFDIHEHQLGWHDTAIMLKGPATDEVEAEWMRRWQRAVDMQASVVTLNDLSNQVRSRYVGPGSRSTIRQRAVALPIVNRTPQPVPVGANANVHIRITRSERNTRYRDLRDGVLERINNAAHYIYMENCQIADPELVQALWAAQARGVNVVIVTNASGGFQGYMTRRSWLQMVLRLAHPHCTRVHYDSTQRGGGVRQVNRNGAAIWNVHDSYDPGVWITDTLKPKQKWLGGDFLEIADHRGNGKEIAFNRIVAVESDFHFYAPFWWRGTGVPADEQYQNPCIHSKLAVFDDQYLVLGSSNWTYRSMQYDGEIAAFIDSGAVAQGTLQRLLQHYDDGTVLQLANGASNIEATAVANLQNMQTNLGLGNDPWALNEVRLLPLLHHDEMLGNVREAPGVGEMPSYLWL